MRRAGYLKLPMRWEMPAFTLTTRLLWGLIAGILTYLYLILSMPFAADVMALGNIGVIVATVVGGNAGMLLQWFIALFRQ